MKSTPNLKPVYFAISVRRLVLMSLVSGGLYELYWQYKNWKAVQKAEGAEMLPFWRAFFAIFYCYSLFKRMARSFRANNYKVLYSPAWLAVAWVALTLLSKMSTLPIPDGLGYTFAILSYLSFLPLVPFQKMVNEYTRNTLDATTEKELSVAEIAILCISLLVWVCIIIAVLV